MFIMTVNFSYGDKFILAQDDDDENNIELKMDDEIKCAPWNTTRAYVQVFNHNDLILHIPANYATTKTLK